MHNLDESPFTVAEMSHFVVGWGGGGEGEF